MKRFSVLLFGLFAFVTILSATPTNGPYGILFGEDVSLSIKKIEASEGTFLIANNDVQGANLRSYNIGDSQDEPIAALDLYSVDGEVVWWCISSQNPTIIFTIAKQLYKDKSFETYQNSAWLVTDDAFIFIQPSPAHREYLLLSGFDTAFVKSGKNGWITGQYEAFYSGYDAYVKYIKNAGSQAPSTQAAAGTGSATKPAYIVGDTGPAGGVIFYDKGKVSDGWRYLEAAPSDQSGGIQWYNGRKIDIETGTAVGTGKANTDAIVAAFGDGSYAAALCKNLTINGFSDWFLPSKDELALMYTNLKKAGLGGFGKDGLWSSSQFNDNFAACEQSFSDGNQVYTWESWEYSVRACRAF